MQCPNNHRFYLPRAAVQQMRHTDSGMARIDYGFLPENDPVPISYLDCPDAACQALAKQHGAPSLYAG